MTPLCYKTVPNCDTIAVLAGGPSIKHKLSNLLEHKPNIIITANYTPVRADYTLFLDDKIYHANKNLPFTNAIIGPRVVIDGKPKKNTLLFRYKKTPKPTTKAPSIVVPKNGKIPHMLCNSGFGALLATAFFNPKKVFILGFDGPSGTTLHHFSGKSPKFAASKLKRNAAYFRKLLKFLGRRTKIYSFEGDNLWGANLSDVCKQLR